MHRCPQLERNRIASFAGVGQIVIQSQLCGISAAQNDRQHSEEAGKESEGELFLGVGRLTISRSAGRIKFARIPRTHEIKRKKTKIIEIIGAPIRDNKTLLAVCIPTQSASPRDKLKNYAKIDDVFISNSKQLHEYTHEKIKKSISVVYNVDFVALQF